MGSHFLSPEDHHSVILFPRRIPFVTTFYNRVDSTPASTEGAPEDFKWPISKVKESLNYCSMARRVEDFVRY